MEINMRGCDFHKDFLDSFLVGCLWIGLGGDGLWKGGGGSWAGWVGGISRNHCSFTSRTVLPRECTRPAFCEFTVISRMFKKYLPPTF